MCGVLWVEPSMHSVWCHVYRTNSQSRRQAVFLHQPFIYLLSWWLAVPGARANSAVLEAICNTCDNFYSPPTRAVTHTAHALTVSMTFSIVVSFWFCFFQPVGPKTSSTASSGSSAMFVYTEVTFDQARFVILSTLLQRDIKRCFSLFRETLLQFNCNSIFEC